LHNTTEQFGMKISLTTFRGQVLVRHYVAYHITVLEKVNTYRYLSCEGQDFENKYISLQILVILYSA